MITNPKVIINIKAPDEQGHDEVVFSQSENAEKPRIPTYAHLLSGRI